MSLNSNLGISGGVNNNIGMLYPQMSTTLPNNPMFNNNNGLFNCNLQAPTADYSNDIRIPSFLKPSFTSQTAEQQVTQTTQQAQNPQYNPSQQLNNQLNNNNAQNPSLVQNNNYQEDIIKLQQEINRRVAQQNPDIGITQNGNLYQTSNIAKKAGGIAGFSIPLATGVFALAKGSKLASAFNVKKLLVKCPLFALAGVAAGAIGDYLINNHRARTADAATVSTNAPTNQNTQKIELKA